MFFVFFQKAGHGLEFLVKSLSVFSDDGLFQEVIYGYFQFLTQPAGGIANFPAIVVERFEDAAGVFFDANGIEMAGNGLLKADNALPVCPFDAALGDAVFIERHVCAGTIGHERRAVALPFKKSIPTFPPKQLHRLGVQKWGYFFKNLLQYRQFIRLKRSAEIAFPTTGTLAGVQIANESFAQNVIADQLVLYDYHNILCANMAFFGNMSYIADHFLLHKAAYMKSLLLSLLFIGAASLLPAQNATPEQKAAETANALKDQFGLSEYQQGKMLHIQLRRYRDRELIAPAKLSNSALYLEQLKAIEDGADGSIHILLSDSQEALFRAFVLEKREKRAQIANELRAQGLPFEQIETAVYESE